MAAAAADHRDRCDEPVQSKDHDAAAAADHCNRAVQSKDHDFLLCQAGVGASNRAPGL